MRTDAPPDPSRRFRALAGAAAGLALLLAPACVSHVVREAAPEVVTTAEEAAPADGSAPGESTVQLLLRQELDWIVKQGRGSEAWPEAAPAR